MDFTTPPPMLRGGPREVAQWAQQLIAWLAGQEVGSEDQEPEETSDCGLTWIERSFSYADFADVDEPIGTITLRAAGTRAIVVTGFLRGLTSFGETQVDAAVDTVAEGNQICDWVKISDLGEMDTAEYMVPAPILIGDEEPIILTVVTSELADLSDLTAGTARVGLLVRDVW